MHVLSLPPAFALSQDQTLTLKRLIWPITCILRRSLTSTKHPTLHSAKHPSVSSERRTTDRHKSLTPDPKAWPQGQTPPASPFLNSNLSKSGFGHPKPAPATDRPGWRPRDPCSTGGTVIPDRLFSGPPQRWRASRARRSSCQPHLGSAVAARRRAGISQKTEDRPAKPAGQSRRLSEDASAPGPLPRPAPMSRGIGPPFRAVNSLLRREDDFLGLRRRQACDGRFAPAFPLPRRPQTSRVRLIPS